MCDIIANNLGGLGPTNGTEEIRYHAVGRVDDTTIDLVVRATSPYDGKATSNGCNGLFGMISVRVGTAVELKFSFEDSATGAPVALDGFFFSFFDLDELEHAASIGGAERITASDFSEFTLAANTQVGVSNATYETSDPTKLTAVFSSTTKGGLSNNPSDPTSLTTKQKKLSVTLKYDDTSSFTVTFEATG